MISEFNSFDELDQSKLRWEVDNSHYTFAVRSWLPDYDNGIVKRHVSSSVARGIIKGWFGGLMLSKNNSGQKEGFLTVVYSEVAEPKKGFGKIIFKKMLEELKKHGYRGIASERKFRSDSANGLWKKIADFSDDRFDYVEKI